MGEPRVGNQLPILLISFTARRGGCQRGWESVTNPLDKLSDEEIAEYAKLGISYQSS